MDDVTEKFLREGLARYAEARATVDEYESAATDKVAEAAKNLTGRLRGAKGKATVTANNFCKGDNNGRVAYAHFSCRAGAAEVTWEVGIWWPHPGDGGQPAVYIQCMKGPDWLKREEWAKAPASPRGAWEAFNGGLHLELEPNADIDAAFGQLLDEAAEQLEALAKKHG